MSQASLSERLRDLRAQAGLGVGELAQLAGVTPAELSAWEQGSSEPTSAQLDATTRAVGLRVRDLLRPPGEWSLDRGLFKASGSTAPRAMPAHAYRTICEFKRCISDIADLELLLGARASALPATRVPFDPVAPYGAVELAARARRDLRVVGAEPVRSMTRLLEEKLDVRVVATTPDDLPASIHAMSTSRPRPAVLINLLDSTPRIRYALAHELCHLLFDFADRTDIVSAEAGAFDDIERRAEAFAANFLAPAAGVREVVLGEPTEQENVKRVAAHFCIGRIHAINRICDTFELPHGTSQRMADRPGLRWEPAFIEEFPAPGLRSGITFDLSMRALAEGRIDEIRAREILRVPTTEWLPEPNPPIEVDDELRRPLRDPTANVRSAVARWIEQKLPSGDASEPVPSAAGWEVDVTAGDKTLRLRVTRDLLVEVAA